MSAPYYETEQVAALLALVNANLGAMATPREAYTPDTAPTTGGNYVTVLLTRRFGGNGRLSAAKLTPSAWRVIVRAVGVGENNALVLLARASQALEDARVSAGGMTSTKVRFETEDPVGEDEYDQSLYSGARNFTYSF